MLTRRELSQRAEHLHTVIEHAITGTQDERLADVDALLDWTIRAAESLVDALLDQAIRAAESVRAPGEQLDPIQLHEYFPPPAPLPTAPDVQQAKRDWRDAFARGRRYRETAFNQVGPLLTPAQVLDRLGISSVTLSKWRRSAKILGLRFDDHQYLYPAWQFVASPELGERGILRHLDRILAALGSCSDWTKARFLLAPQPRFGSSSPLDLLVHGPDQAMLDRILDLARHVGETGQ
jgi:hypothetical protein